MHFVVSASKCLLWLASHTNSGLPGIMAGTEHEIRAEKCSDTCHHKMKFVLTFTKNNLTLVEINAITYMSDQSGNCTGQHQKCSENVRCPTVISCSEVHGS